MVYVALILSTLSCHLSSLKGRVLDLRHVGVAGPLELSPHSPSLSLRGLVVAAVNQATSFATQGPVNGPQNQRHLPQCIDFGICKVPPFA